MSTSQHLISAVIIISTLLGVEGSNGYHTSTVDQCCYSSDLSHLEYIRSYWFNKAEYIQFNSTVGKFVGYTELGVYNAEAWNKDPAYLAQMQAQKDTYCKPNAQKEIDAILTKKVQPVVRLRLEEASIGGQPTVLVCSAYDFYPKMIRVTWHRDGQEVTGDVIYSEELADGDWYYQIHSHLEFTPKAGEKISCVVEHASLRDPLEITWDPSMPEPERKKIAIGAASLVLGLIVFAAGFIYYKRKCRGWILAPKSCMDQSLDMYAHHKNIDSYFLWLLKSYRSVTVHCDSTKTPIKKSIMITGDSNHQDC
ncbi:rano class II histocompatibility antigen, A beta chain-like isoform X2 [Clupea harengus]|uniref:Rano class II histocompatibility antigen, A beta chain-like isoform X2 n=1 Tax=Clupea harengus TaxID=7950 RepID=A0A6P3VKW0_CLUHA|nr:rano class II histocompatibility antigen, A beta chain-like isoform X2 [Clupea harengus]